MNVIITMAGCCHIVCVYNLWQSTRDVIGSVIEFISLPISISSSINHDILASDNIILQSSQKACENQHKAFGCYPFPGCLIPSNVSRFRGWTAKWHVAVM